MSSFQIQGNPPVKRDHPPVKDNEQVDDVISSNDGCSQTFCNRSMILLLCVFMFSLLYSVDSLSSFGHPWTKWVQPSNPSPSCSLFNTRWITVLDTGAIWNHPSVRLQILVLLEPIQWG